MTKPAKIRLVPPPKEATTERASPKATASHDRSVDERAEAGKALRVTISRSAQRTDRTR